MTQRTGPSPTTLALLGGAVLGVHLGVLSGPAMPPRDTPASARIALPTGTPAAPPTVLVTQVRTVPLALAAAPAPTAPAPPVAPVRPAKAAAPPPAPSTAPVPAAAQPTPAPVPAATVAHVPAPTDERTVEHADADGTAAPLSLAQATSPALATTNTTPAGAGAGPTLPTSKLPPSITLPYDVVGEARGLSYRASGQLDWRLDAQGYEARMELSMLFLGSRVQTSRGSVGPEGPRPERFADQRRSERAAHFDREAGRIRFSNNAPPAALLPGAQDRLSLFMQLAGLLRARQHTQGDVITFQVVGVGDAEPWQFEVGPLETLELPAGTMEARRITRTPRKPHDSKVEVWLAPSVAHLPVRLRVQQANGDVADQRLARLP